MNSGSISTRTIHGEGKQAHLVASTGLATPVNAAVAITASLDNGGALLPNPKGEGLVTLTKRQLDLLNKIIQMGGEVEFHGNHIHPSTLESRSDRVVLWALHRMKFLDHTYDDSLCVAGYVNVFSINNKVKIDDAS